MQEMIDVLRQTLVDEIKSVERTITNIHDRINDLESRLAYITNKVEN